MVRTPHPTAMVVWLQREHCLQLGPFGPFVLGDFFLRSSGLRGHRVEAGSRVQSGGLPQGRCCVTCWLGCRANITVSLAWRSVAVITPPYPRNLVPVTVHNRLRCPRRISAVVVNIVCMFSSPKHKPLCVRVRPGDTCGARDTSQQAPGRGCSLCASNRLVWFYSPNASRGARPDGKAQIGNRIIIQQCCNPLGCLCRRRQADDCAV